MINKTFFIITSTQKWTIGHKSVVLVALTRIPCFTFTVNYILQPEGANEKKIMLQGQKRADT